MAEPCRVVMYHYVREVPGTSFQGIRPLTPDAFVAQLDWLQARYRILEPDAFLDAVATRTPLPEPCAILTFDDGLRDHYDTAFPILRERGLGAVFYVAGATVAEPPSMLGVHMAHVLLGQLGAEELSKEVRTSLEDMDAGAHRALDHRSEVYRYDESAETRLKHLLNYELLQETTDAVLRRLFTEHVGGEAEFARKLYLSPAMIREMANQGMTFGFHTHRHRILSRLGATEQRTELAGGVELVRELTGQRNVSFCYPYGHVHTYDETTMALLAELGYTGAFSARRGDASSVADPVYDLPRRDTADLPPLGEIEVA